MGYFCPKNAFLKLKYYTQGIYLTLLLITYMKILQIHHAIFETIGHFSRHNSTGFFFSFNITYFLQKQPIKVLIFRLSSTHVKIHQIPHVIFQTKSQFFFKVWITLQCHERSFFCTFLAENLYATDKSSTSKCKLSDLPLLALKFTEFLSFLEPRVSFSSNFASLFNVMRQNSFVRFPLNLYMLWTKGANQGANFQTFDCSHEN